MCEDIEVCVCLRITLQEILEAIENGANSIEDIQKQTKAGTVCKLCISPEEDIYGERDIHLTELLK
jgi:NAD(P)H-nitrite reductase large subunit